MRPLRPTHALAQTLGPGLAPGALLLGALPPPEPFGGARTVTWPATRAAGLARLAGFLPRAGAHYQRLRNHDLGPDDRSNVSGLSPYLRHRLVLEQEVLDAVLGRFAPSSADKFVQEVFWRCYWKGWLEHHPETWTRYRSALDEQLAGLATDDDLALRYQAAVEGETGIEPFDAWARELTATGYLHNHARMWFASIWIFTLELPWVLGADWFLRQLLDGDPASNTLSWRWVAGLHTRGKTYLARPDNIVRYAGARFGVGGAAPGGLERLVDVAEALPEATAPPRAEPGWPGGVPGSGGRRGLLLGADDLHLDVPGETVALAALAPPPRSPLAVGEIAAGFTRDAIEDALSRAGAQRDGVPAGQLSTTSEVAAWAREHDLDRVVMAYAPVGPGQAHQQAVAAALDRAGVDFARFLRPIDRLAWPHARRGFFQLRKQIPRILDALAG